MALINWNGDCGPVVSNWMRKWDLTRKNIFSGKEPLWQLGNYRRLMLFWKLVMSWLKLHFCLVLNIFQWLFSGIWCIRGCKIARCKLCMQYCKNIGYYLIWTACKNMLKPFSLKSQHIPRSPHFFVRILTLPDVYYIFQFSRFETEWDILFQFGCQKWLLIKR